MAGHADEQAAPERNVRHTVHLGRSFGRASTHLGVHTLRYSFKPSSSDWTKRGRVAISGQVATLKQPAVSGNGDITFRGKAEEHRATDCLLVCDSDGRWTLERMKRNVKDLKAERE